MVLRAIGSSPLTRGKLHIGDKRINRRRLIPAHAGKTWCLSCGALAHWAHPRSRGENPASSPSGRATHGSSPLTRGKRTLRDRDRAEGGLIPAHAGKTGPPRQLNDPGQAHPRSRGENPVGGAFPDRSEGSSPLTRGKRRISRVAPGRVRLIPAHAGKTNSGVGAGNHAWAHPRSRGENSSCQGRSPRHRGSSPLTRGKRETRGRH